MYTLTRYGNCSLEEIEKVERGKEGKGIGGGAEGERRGGKEEGRKRGGNGESGGVEE